MAFREDRLFWRWSQKARSESWREGVRVRCGFSSSWVLVTERLSSDTEGVEPKNESCRIGLM